MSHPTEQQQRAIEASGSVLLAAGAGTGKTATLVGRCLRLVTAGGAELDRFLVVTFTNAAAAEMKQRMREALREAVVARPDDERLQRQLLLLESASISTIHSFCLELVRAHFAELGLDPGVTVLDESVAAPLARRTMFQVLQRAIDAGSGTRELADQYCGGSGERLAKLVLRTHRFFVAQPQADVLLQREIERFSNSTPADWCRHRPEIIQTWLCDWAQPVQAQVPRTLQDLTSVRGYGGRSKTADSIRNIEDRLPGFAGRLALLGPACAEETVDDLLAQAVELGTKAVWVRGLGKARGVLKEFFTEAALLQSWQAAGDSDPLESEWACVRGPIRQLLEITRAFRDEFTKAKRALGGLDFADLEQLALRLLLDEQGQPTSIAGEWRERLDHVLVDECQDVNAAQDSLLHALARTGRRANLFLVGDVKQSIYRFRLAAPELFQHHAQTWPRKELHKVLPLTENFRSREGILAFVDDLFGFLLGPGLGGVGYGAEERIRFALPEARKALSLAPDPGGGPAGVWPDPDCRVELHLVLDTSPDSSPPEDGDEGWQDLLSLERQARVAATRLRVLMDQGHEVWDKGETRFRPMRWSDVGLLMRAVRGRSVAFLREFRRLGIPLVVERGDFLETLEASDLAALLRVLDNPRQDIPLFAVLRSPLAGWTLDELVGLRRAAQEARAWECVEAAARGDGPIGDKARRFLDSLARWRRLALVTSLTAVIETVLTDTGYEAYLLALPDGIDRVARVRRFLDLARRYDPLQRQGLHRFLRFLAEQKEADREIEPLPPRQAEAVQLLSIHKSKGLEFPVVVLAGMGGAFPQQDLKEPILFSRRRGVAPQVVNLPARRRHDSLLLWHVKREERLASIAEELRLFYVAVTRARDTLLLVGSFDPGRKGWQERTSMAPAVGVAQARSYCEWVGMWAGGSAHWSAGRGEIAFPAAAPVARLRWQTYGSDIAPAPAEAAPTAPQAMPPTIPESSLRHFGWRYPHLASTKTPAKTSATALRRLGQADDEAAALWSPRPRLAPLEESETGGRLSATAIGSAHHLFLQTMDLACGGSAEDLAGELQRLRARGVLRPAEADAIDLESIRAFWASSIGADIRQHADAVRRELAFTAAFSPAELPPFADRFNPGPVEEFVVVQGAVDLAVLLPSEIWIVDFKTDRVTAPELPARAAEHEPQLRLYAAAVHRIYERPVTRCALYFLALRRCWDVANPTPSGAAAQPADPRPATTRTPSS